MKMKLCVFPNDPLSSYYKKGEIKERYFNPKNIFDEIHVISLFDSDINEEKVKKVAGNANFKIHAVGKVNLLNKNKMKKKIVRLISEIKPDVIRSYNPLLQGWIAAHVKKELGMPLVISLHGNYDLDLRHQARIKKDYKSFLRLQITRQILEKFALRNADEIIIVYEFVRNYAEKLGGKNINLIYNKIDLSKFSPDVIPKIVEKKPIIICVGRLMKEKNQECLIHAIKDLDVILVLIGDGPQYSDLNKLVEKLNIKHKVRFERSVSNDEINSYYTSADIFALPIKYGGFAIPVLEAAASGIPVILPKPEFDSDSEIIEKFAMLVDNSINSFQLAIKKILSNKLLKNKMQKNGIDTIKKISGDIMEEKEKELYLKVISKD